MCRTAEERGRIRRPLSLSDWSNLVCLGKSIVHASVQQNQVSTLVRHKVRVCACETTSNDSRRQNRDMIAAARVSSC